METNKGDIQPKTRKTFFTSLFSISLVLFFLGICMMAAMAGKLVVDTAKEELELKVLIADDTPDHEIQMIRAQLIRHPGINSVRFLSKEAAGQEFVETTGDDFREAIGHFNPFMASLNLRLKKEYVTRDSILKLQTVLLQNPAVAELDYPIELIARVDENTHVLAQIGLLIGCIVMAITYFLIYGTVRLSVYSRRLIIRTMQLIGATPGFIRRPFVMSGVLQGLLGGIIASALLILGQVGITQQFPFLQSLWLQYEIFSVYLFLVVTGTLLGWISSRMAVNRFLHKRLDEIA
ncbi:MAG: FtsX-like permease family protein [Sphingobacteriia bacterium]|nr:FtsX-like permease family protein [Sphingobacteriia bacterium]